MVKIFRSTRTCQTPLPTTELSNRVRSVRVPWRQRALTLRLTRPFRRLARVRRSDSRCPASLRRIRPLLPEATHPDKLTFGVRRIQMDCAGRGKADGSRDTCLCPTKRRRTQVRLNVATIKIPTWIAHWPVPSHGNPKRHPGTVWRALASRLGRIDPVSLNRTHRPRLTLIWA